MILLYHLVGHEILNKTVYFCHFNEYFLCNCKWQKCLQSGEKRKFKNENLIMR